MAKITIELGEYTTIKRLRLNEKQNVQDYIQHAPILSETMYSEIIDTLESLRTPLKQIALNLYRDHHDELLRWSGAVKVHHAVYGRLLYHSYRMMKAAEKICEIYPEVDRELLIVAVVLHGIGKLKELDTKEAGVVEFTADSNLQGHTLLDVIMVHEEVYLINTYWDVDDPVIPNEQLMLLEHMIASHHGELEYGAIVQQATKEATLLNLLDMIDSRMSIYENAEANLQPGTFSESVRYVGGARIYKPNTTID